MYQLFLNKKLKKVVILKKYSISSSFILDSSSNWDVFCEGSFCYLSALVENMKGVFI